MLRELQDGDPQFIGPYRLRGLLGVGGMGRVFLGVSPGGRLVAVKVIRTDLATDREFRARFRREVTVARQVSSQFTAPVIDADIDGAVPWLATAYVPGPSLADAVAEHGPLPIRSVLELAAGLAEGLGAIHAAGVVHRDLKPSNVLLAQDGPRVIDFGISQVNWGVQATGGAQGPEAGALTGTGLVMGSPGFMSPEQAEGREVGPPSDIFSLGAVLAFAATGRGPFGGGSTPALVYRVVYRPASLGEVPAGVRALIERCLAKDPSQRPTPGQVLAGTGTVQPTAGWLPEPVTRTFAQLPALADPSPTVTSAKLPAPGAPVPAQAGRREDRRRRRGLGRPLAIAAMVAGLVAASAAGGVAFTALGHQAASMHSGQGLSGTPATSAPRVPAARTTSQAATAAPSTSAPATAPTSPTATPTATATMAPSASMSAPASPAPTATAPAPSATAPAAGATPPVSALPAASPAPSGSPD